MTGVWRARAPIVVPAASAALLRLLHYVFNLRADPLFFDPVVDARFHANQARTILESGWLLPGTGAFYKGPLYSYVLAPLFSVFGETAGVALGRLLSLALGTVTVACLAWLAGRLAGRLAAWIAGLAAALYGTAIHFDATLLLVPVVTVLLVLAGERLDRARGQARPELPLAVAGALLGLVTITRANGLLVILAAAAWALLLARRRWEGLPGWRAAALVALPALLVIAPVTARNAVLERDPVLVSWNGGINLFMGNDPAFDQGSGNWNPDLAWMRLYDAPDQMGLTRGSEHQRFFVGQTVARAADEPGWTLAVLARKAGLLFTAYEIPNNRRFEDARARSPVLAVLMADGGPVALPWSLFAPLIAAGLVLAAGRGLRLHEQPLLWLAASWAITPVLFFNTARYRLPAVLLLIPLAAAGWARLAEVRPTAGRAVAAAVVAAAVLLVGAATVPARPALPLSDEIHLAARAERRGDDAEALRWLEEAVARDPSDPFARMRLADHLRTRRRCTKALEHYRAVRARPELAADWHNAAMRSEARCLAALRRDDAAIDLYRRFLAGDPDRPVTEGRPDFHLRGTPPLVACEHRIELAVALDQAGRRAQAVAELGRVIEVCGDAEPIAAEARRRLAVMAGQAPAGPQKRGSSSPPRGR
jgi:4-amino-4-deoxy-L-arabinose transferase-like glycosyltransferase